ncbi:MAG: hypothetical protein NPMRTH1_1190003 [Nitrosopumilales archaeon]|nr:MAG: hypothetical protein NPMRTH1_1190003 [Nitrosopumilales archaeon]
MRFGNLPLNTIFMKTNFDNYLSFINDLFEIIRKNRLYRRDHSSLPVRIKCK